MSLSYAIIGVGGVGGYLGAKLAQAGFDVHFLANSDFDHIKKHGLKVDSYRGNMHLPDVHVYNDPSAMPRCV